jgi:hypothetical protein
MFQIFGKSRIAFTYFKEMPEGIRESGQQAKTLRFNSGINTNQKTQKTDYKILKKKFMYVYNSGITQE